MLMPFTSFKNTKSLKLTVGILHAIHDKRIAEPQTSLSHVIGACRLIPESHEGMNLEIVSSQFGTVNRETVGESLYIITMLLSLGTIQLSENSWQ